MESKEQVLWENKIWRLALPAWNRFLPIIENKITGFCDYPTYYGNYQTGYNYPGRVPKYVRIKIAVLLHKQHQI